MACNCKKTKVVAQPQRQPKASTQQAVTTREQKGLNHRRIYRRALH